MNLGMLVSQLLYEPPPKKITLRDPLCPKCKERPRTISSESGRVADYCRAWKREFSDRAREKAAIKRRVESNYGN